MSRAIRAVYEGGRLRLLDPVELAEGEQVNIAILHNIDRQRELEALRSVLVNAVRFPDDVPDRDEEIDWEPLVFERLHPGENVASEYIIQERREGP